MINEGLEEKMLETPDSGELENSECKNLLMKFFLQLSFPSIHLSLSLSLSFFLKPLSSVISP
jgi:hypothetical protein